MYTHIYPHIPTHIPIGSPGLLVPHLPQGALTEESETETGAVRAGDHDGGCGGRWEKFIRKKRKKKTGEKSAMIQQFDILLGQVTQ